MQLINPKVYYQTEVHHHKLLYALQMSPNQSHGKVFSLITSLHYCYMWFQRSHLPVKQKKIVYLVNTLTVSFRILKNRIESLTLSDTKAAFTVNGTTVHPQTVPCLQVSQRDITRPTLKTTMIHILLWFFINNVYIHTYTCMYICQKIIVYIYKLYKYRHVNTCKDFQNIYCTCVCIYIYIINIHSTHTYIMQTKLLFWMWLIVWQH